MKKLSLRLETLLSMIPSNVHYLVDVGADHGYFILEAIARKRVESGMAVENKKGPYTHLVEMVKKYHFENQVETSFSSGLEKVKVPLDLALIAGMGTPTILSILHHDIEKLKDIHYLLIDAHNQLPELRKEVTRLGYKIIGEEIVEEEQVFYELVLFERGEESYLQEDYDFGPILRKEKDATFKKKWQGKIKKNLELLKNPLLTENRKKELMDEIHYWEKQL